MLDRKPNFLIRSFNLDVLGVMKPQELLAKVVFDAGTLIVVGSVAYELVTGPTTYFIDNVRNALLATGIDLAINYTNREYWVERLNERNKA